MKALFSLIQRWLILPLKKSFSRFPEAMVVSFLLGITSIMNNNLESQIIWIQDISRTLFLLLPLAIVTTLIKEQWGWLNKHAWVNAVSGVLIGINLFVYLTWEPSLYVSLLRFSNLAYACYLLVIITPYLLNHRQIAIGIILFFTKFFVALFYALVLFVGVFVVLISINVLFNLSIELSFYVDVFVFIMTFIFIPILLDAYPLAKESLDLNQDFHPVWQRVFVFVIAPVISVFSFLIILYLLTSFVNLDSYEPEIYTFSALVIAFVGISTQVALEPLSQTNRFTKIYTNSFHVALAVVMVGYYLEQFKSISVEGMTSSVVIQLMLGLWPLTYAWFKVRRNTTAVHRGLAALVGAFLAIGVLPGLNAISLTTYALRHQLVTTLEAANMVDEEQNIVPNNAIPNLTYQRLMVTLEEMELLGFHRFPLVPNGYQHPDDFSVVFGRQAFEDEGFEEEMLFYSLTASVIDLSEFNYNALVFVSSLHELKNTPYLGSTIQLSYQEDIEAHEYRLTITSLPVTSTLDLYKDVALELRSRLMRDEFQTTNPIEMRLQLQVEGGRLDIWVLSCISSQGETFNSFTMGFYLGVVHE